MGSLPYIEGDLVGIAGGVDEKAPLKLGFLINRLEKSCKILKNILKI